MRGRFIKNSSPRGLLLAMMVLLVVALAPPLSECFADEEFSEVGERGHFDYAEMLFREGSYTDAAEEFASFAADYPESRYLCEARIMVGESYIEGGYNKEARSYLRAFIEEQNACDLDKRASLLIERAERRMTSHLEDGVNAPPNGLRRITLSAVEPIRGVQVALFEGATIADMREEIRRLKVAGVDTIILRVFHNEGDRSYRFVEPRSESGVYFRTKHAPVLGDVLGKVVRIAHAEHLKVFAWMTTRYADYGIEDKAELACRGFDLSKSAYYRCKGLDLFNENAIRHLEALYSDLGSYDIDGILFQDDLVLRHTEGFGPSAAALYSKKMGRALDPGNFYHFDADGHVTYTPLFWEWASWKNKRLLNVASRLIDAAKRANPDLKFAVNLMYESIVNPSHALAWLSQDFKRAMDTGFDYYSVMAYHRQMADELDESHREVGELIASMADEAAKEVVEPHRVLIKLQTIDWSTGESLSESEVISMLRKVEASGVSLALVPYRADFPYHELGRSAGVARADIEGGVHGD